MEEKAFFNNKLVDIKQASLSVTGPAALYGIGLFETMRSYGSRIIYLDEHLERIKRSARLISLKIPYPAKKIKEQIAGVIKANKLDDAYVRLTVWKESDSKSAVLICARKYKQFPKSKYARGFSCMVSSLRQNEGSFLSRIKSTNYLFHLTAHLQAIKAGFDQALILNNQGYICESSRANIFLVKNKEIFTPKPESGCLEGITRQAVLALAKKEKIACQQANFTLQDLYNADEAFLTNSLMGIMPVGSIEGIKIASAGNDSITSLLMNKYRKLLKNAR
jgi:branched-chain amino acid aminotransferase